MTRCIHAYHHSRVMPAQRPAGWVCSMEQLADIDPANCLYCPHFEAWDGCYELDAAILLARVILHTRETVGRSRRHRFDLCDRPQENVPIPPTPAECQWLKELGIG